MEKMSLPTGLLSLTVAEHRQIYGHTRMATFLTHASADAHVGSQSRGTPRSLCRLPVKWNSTKLLSAPSQVELHDEFVWHLGDAFYAFSGLTRRFQEQWRSGGDLKPHRWARPLWHLGDAIYDSNAVLL